MYNLVNHSGENSGLWFSDWFRDYSTVDANPQGKPSHHEFARNTLSLPSLNEAQRMTGP